MHNPQFNQDTLPFYIWNRFIDAWDNQFYMSLRHKKIQAIIHSYQAIVIMPVCGTTDVAGKFARFESRYQRFMDQVYLDGPRGADFTLAWCQPGNDGMHSVAAIAMIHPFQAEFYHRHAFGETAEDLGLNIDYLEVENRRKPMLRWERISQSIIAGAGQAKAADNMRFFSTRNTMWPD